MIQDLAMAVIFAVLFLFFYFTDKPWTPHYRSIRTAWSKPFIYTRDYERLAFKVKRMKSK